jgi:hypothetical protein
MEGAMRAKRFKFIALLCLLITGCASWFHEEGDEPVAYNPEALFRQTWSSFSGAAIKAGYAEADITPFRHQYLAGYKPGRKSKTVIHPLRAQCLALEDDQGEKLMIVTLDLMGLVQDFVDEILNQVNNWPKDRILFCSSHTHSAPDTFGIWGNGIIVIPLVDGKDPVYLKRIQTDIARAIEAASDAVERMSLAVPQERATLRFGSDTVTPDCISATQPGIEPDLTFSLIQVAIDHHTVTLFNFGLHPTLNTGRYVTPDFVFFLRQYFETYGGGRLMFVNGALGGVEPILEPQQCRPNYQYQGRWVRAREIGEELALSAINALKNQPIVPPAADIHFEKKDLEVSLESWLFRLAIDTGLLPGITDQTQDWKLVTPIHYVTIGPAAILTAPGELFPERWEAIKPQLSGQPKFIFALTNVELGYIMSKAYAQSGQYPYFSELMNIGDEEFGEKLIDVYRRLIAP